jgi:hypothetical protein
MIRHNLWDVPACSSFLNRITSLLIDGNIVVSFLPKNAPDGFIRYLKKSFEKWEFYNSEEISFADFDPGSVSFAIDKYIFNHFELANEKEFVNADIEAILKTSVCKEVDFFILKEIKPSLKESLKDFIIRLRSVVLSYSTVLRPKVLINLDPECFHENDLPKDNGICVERFYGIFDNHDTKIAIKYYFDQNAIDRETLLKHSILSNIATFDIEFAEYLVNVDIKKLLNSKFDDFGDFVHNRGWDGIVDKSIRSLTENERWYLWSKGVIDVFDGNLDYHTGFLFLHDREMEIVSRMWKGQANYLLPIVEDVRVMILNMEEIVFPETLYNDKTNKTFNNKFELEIGEIFHYFSKNKVVKFQGIDYGDQIILTGLVKACYNARRELSHQKLLADYQVEKLLAKYQEVLKVIGRG